MHPCMCISDVCLLEKPQGKRQALPNSMCCTKGEESQQAIKSDSLANSSV